MTKYKLTILLFSTIFIFKNVQAGWYECYNFKGTIDKYPITFSIQVREEYFGEKEKKDFNIIGIYKYDKQNTPIRLEGKINFTTNKALLYEISNNKHSAIFEFDFSEVACNGIWKNLSTNKIMPLHLDYVSKLIDTSTNNQFTNIQILQASSLTDFYFIGEYSKIAGRNRAEMSKLKIMKKTDNTIFQIIDFSKVESQTGNIMTIIFDNVEVIDPKTKELNVSNDFGNMNGYLTIYFNPTTKAFKLNPKPKLYESN